MIPHLTILYRGPLSSCNYGCDYCPFAKHRESRAELQADRTALNRFVDWCESQNGRLEISVLFTPWGEALVRRWYQHALARLTMMPHVRKAAIQTNLSCQLDWTQQCDLQKLGLWCTYHPGETTRERFLGRCRELDRRSIRYSVGMVGLKEHLDEIEAMRQELPTSVYLWANAYKRQPDYYTTAEVERLANVDSLFPFNNARHPSLGLRCRTGEDVISVDGDGNARRCHFVPERIGNIYDVNYEAMLQPRLCPNATCGCHIGYVHLEDLGLYAAFGDGLLERIPNPQVSAMG